MVHLISTHNLDILTQAKNSHQGQWEIIIFFFKDPAKDFGICLLVLHTVFSMQGKLSFGCIKA